MLLLSINNFTIWRILALFAIALWSSSSGRSGLLAHARVMPIKGDCVDLWNVVSGQGNALDLLRRVQVKGGAANDDSGLLRLYEDCLRAVEGIRYRRNSSPDSRGSSASAPGSSGPLYSDNTYATPSGSESTYSRAAKAPIELAIRSAFGQTDSAIPEVKLNTDRIINKLKQFLSRM